MIRASPTVGDVPVLVLCAVLYVPFVFLGYGTDLDTYLALEAGQRLLAGEAYVPSRNPGFLLHEVTAAALAAIGGSVLANAATATAALSGLACFLALCRRFEVAHARLLTLVLAAQPYFWIAATSTADHVWTVALLLGGWLLLDRGRAGAAGLAWGLAAGFRPPALGLVAVLLVTVPQVRRALRLGAAAIAIPLGAAALLPSLVHAGFTLGFLHAHTGPPELWTWSARLGRFLYKNFGLFLGLPASLLLLGAAATVARSLWRARGRSVVRSSLALVLATELLYFAYPLEPSYLLPALPFLLLLLSVALGHRRRLLAAVAVLLVSTNVVLVVVARPNVVNRATGATLGLWVEPGILLQDVRSRLALRRAQTVEDWQAVMQGPGLGRGGSR